MWSRVIVCVTLLCLFMCRSADALALIVENVQNNEVNEANSSSVPHNLGVWATNCEISSCVAFCESIGYIFGNCNGNYCICTYPRETNNGLDEPAKLDGCNPIQCDQNCRRIGFNGGACVGNKCKCDILQPSGKDVDYIGTKDTCEHVYNCNNTSTAAGCRCLTTNMEMSIPANSLASCQLASCNSYCRSIGFITGYCLFDICMCKYPKPTKKRQQTQDKYFKKPNASEAPPKLGVFATECDTSSCVGYCGSIGYVFGNCNGNYCICAYPRENNNGLDESTSDKLDGCNPIQCDQNCRRIGFNGGACVGNKCKCDILQSDDTETSISTDSVASCVWFSCNSYCRAIGFISGYCLFDTCMCKFPKPKEKPHHTESKTHDLNTVRVSITLGECNEGTCSRLCRRLGYDEQQCYGDKCTCTRSQKGFEKIDRSETSCNGVQCEQLCRRLGFTGGACVGDKCKCDIIMEIEAMIEPTPRSTQGSCNPRQCEQNCRKIGFKGGACVNGRCKCDILHDREESSTHHLHSREASNCENNKCDRLCRRVHYDRGMCIGDRCKCDVLFPIKDSVIPTDLGGSCTARRCESFCRSIGFSGSNCVGSRCRCEILLQKEDNDITALHEDNDTINIRHL